MRLGSWILGWEPVVLRGIGVCPAGHVSSPASSLFRHICVWGISIATVGERRVLLPVEPRGPDRGTDINCGSVKVGGRTRTLCGRVSGGAVEAGDSGQGGRGLFPPLSPSKPAFNRVNYQLKGTG